MRRRPAPHPPAPSASPSSTCPPASSAPPSTTAGRRLQALADELSVLRPREVLVPARPPVADAICRRSRRSACAVTEADEVDVRPARRRAQPASSSSASTASTASGCAIARPPLAPQAACCGTSATRRRPTSRTSQSLAFRSAADALRIDAVTCRHLELITGSEGQAEGSLLHEIDRTSSAMGGRLLRAWMLRPLVELERIRERLDAVEEFGVPDAGARPRARGAWRRCTTSSACWAAWCWARPARATSSRSAGRARSSPTSRRCLADAAAPLLGACRAELDDLADVRQRIERTLRRRAAGPGARGRLHARRPRSGDRRAAHHQPVRAAGHRRHGDGRARAHRHRAR